MDSTSTPRDDGLLSRVTALESKIAQLEAARVEPATPKDVEKAVEEAKRYRDIAWFRQYGTSPLSAYYIAGMIGARAITSTTTIDANKLYGIPFFTGKGGRIDSTALYISGGAAGGRECRTGIYSNTSDSEAYPYQLIVDFGVYDCSTTGLKSTPATVILPEDELLWVTVVGNNASTAYRAILQDGMHPIYGWDMGAATDPGHSVSVSYTYGTLPQNYPGGGSVYAGAGLPAVGLRFFG